MTKIFQSVKAGISGLGRPSIRKVLEAELYANQRMLIDDEAKAENALLQAQQYKQTAVARGATVKRIHRQLQALQ